MRYVFILKDGRVPVFDEEGANEWLMEVFSVNWPVTVLCEEGEHTWVRMVPELVWSNSQRKYVIEWQYFV